MNQQYYSNVHRKMAEHPTLFVSIANIAARPVVYFLDYIKKYDEQNAEKRRQEEQRYLKWLP